MRTYKSESNIRPVEWQKELTTVYHNQNIIEVEKETGFDGEVTTMYQYDVTEYTVEEYLLMKNKEQDNAIDDILVALLEG